MMAIVCAGLMLGLLVFSYDAMAAALAAARCFVNGVLPALLPMMVLGKMLPDCTKYERSSLGRWLELTLFSFAAGSPASAQRAAGRREAFSERDWECLLCLTGVMSPMFFTGTLAGWLESARDGWLLLGLHWLGAAVTAGLWRVLSTADKAPAAAARRTPADKTALPQAIAQSAQSLLCVCGAMMVFSVAAALVRSLLGAIFPAWTARHADWLAVLWAVMEIGGGSNSVIRTCAHPQALLSALCGFGGLSIWLQNLLFLEKSIRPAKLLAMRALHGAVCYALVRAFSPF